MIVSGCRNGGSQQPLIVVHRLNDCCQKQQELGVFVGRFAGREQVDAGISGEGPVVVLAAAIDPGKGLFVEQAHHAVLGGHPLHDLHGQLVLVGGAVGGGIDGGKLVLGRRYLVVLCFGQDAQLPQLGVQLLHKGGYPGLDGAEIVVVQLLSLGGLGAEQRSAGVDQIPALLIQRLVDQEVFLLRADRGRHVLDRLVAEQLQHPECLPVQCLHAAQKGRFFIQRLSAVGAEGCGDTEGLALDEGVAGGIPCRVAPGLKGGAQTAGGEGGGVRLPADQLLAGEFHDHSAVRRRGDKAVVLFRRDPGQGLEPVGEVGRAVLDCPVLHGGGHRVGHRRIQLGSFLDGMLQRVVHLSGQTGLHHAAVKDFTSKYFRYSRHSRSSFQKNKKRHRRHGRLCLRDANVSQYRKIYIPPPGKSTVDLLKIPFCRDAIFGKL